MEQHDKTLKDYLALILRRRYYILLTFSVITGASILLVEALPDTYRSTATLLMQTPIPPDMVQSAVPDYAGQEVKTVLHKSMMSAPLLDIIKSSQLYPKEEIRMSAEELVALFKKQIEIKLLKSELMTTDNTGQTDIPFTLTYTHAQAEKAHEAVNRLAMILIAKNDAERSEKANRKAEFLRLETDKLRVALEDMDNRISLFKQAHDGSLPEQLPMNMALIERKQEDLREVDKNIIATQERMDFMTADRATSEQGGHSHTEEHSHTEGHHHGENQASLDTADQRKLLERQYLALSSRYYPNHPDIIRVKHQIEALDTQVTGIFLKEREHESSDGVTKAHPKIESVKTGMNASDKTLASQEFAPPPATHKKAESHSHSNAIYNSFKARYQIGQQTLQELLNDKQNLKTEIALLQHKMSLTPDVEKDYNGMVRERDNAVNKYTQLKDKLTDAQLMQTLETEQQGQTLTLIEAPNQPAKPDNTIKRKIVFAGLFFGMLAGIGVAFLLEQLYPRVRGKRELSAVTGLIPLVLIPYLETPYELEKRMALQRRSRLTVTALMVVTFMLIMVAAGVFYLREEGSRMVMAAVLGY